MVGTTISHYLILEELGRGGMGIVYRALDERLEREVALKILPSQQLATEQERARLFSEAHAAAQLNHPGIATVHEIDDDEGIAFIVMELVQGEDLAARIRNGGITVDEACSIGAQIAEALSAAHEKMIVHRDVKPSNVMVTPKGQVKLLDFGLAKEQGRMGLTQSDQNVGTLPYMSPEQLRGERADWRSDAWSLGVILFEMLTGQRPFNGEYEVAVLYQIQNERPSRLSDLVEDIPPEIESIVESLLVKRDVDRTVPLDEVAKILRSRVSGGGLIPFRHLKAQGAPRRIYLSFALICTVVFAWWMSAAETGELPHVRAGTVAIMPFSVSGDGAPSGMGEGLVNLMAAYLDGMGDFTVVDPNVVLASTSGASVRMSVADARKWSDRLRAERFIMGSVTRLRETVIMEARLYDRENKPAGVASVEVADSLSLTDGVAELAKEILTQQFPEISAENERTAIRTSRDREALADYLEGETAFRKDVFSSRADSLFTRAVLKDSTFAMAWIRLGLVSMWRQKVDRAKASFRRAEELEQDLPAREQVLLKACIARIHADLEGLRAIVEDAVHDNPYEASLMGLLGDWEYHTYSRQGRSVEEAYRWLAEAHRLVPNNDEFTHHLIQIAAELNHWDYLRELTRGLPDEERWDRLITIGSLDIDKRANVIASLGLSHPGEFLSLAQQSLWFLEDAALAEKLTRMAPEPSTPAMLRDLIRYRGMALVAQGRLHEARETFDLLPDDVGPFFSSTELTTALPNHELEPERADSLLGDYLRWDYEPMRTTWLPLHATGFTRWIQNDREGLQDVISRLERAYQANPSDSMAFVYARRLEAFAANMDQDYQGVLDAQDAAMDFMQSSDIPGGGWWDMRNDVWDVFMRAEAYLKLGQLTESLAWFDGLGDGSHRSSSVPIHMMGLMAPSYRYRALIHEELGNVEQAIHFYQRFITLWANADSKFQPVVCEAERSLNIMLGVESADAVC